MSTENNNENIDVVQEEASLDDFEAEFFGRNDADPEPASSDEDVEDEDPDNDASTPEEESQEDEDDGLEDEADEHEEEEPAPKPKKSRFQERIDELTGKAREAERREKAALDRIEALEAKLTKQEPEETKSNNKEVAGPAPDEVNEDGTDKYPLGEFDPNYIRDLTKFTLEQERNALREQEDAERKGRELQEAQEALQASWQEKIVPAQERYPDFREKSEGLLETFSGVEQSYGEYLAATIMDMDFGPDVLYYLANNVDEATKIVNSGPARATRELYHLEAKFAFANEEKEKARPKVSKAPAPPPTNKGTAVAMPDIPDDTDNLDDFSRKFFTDKKGRR